MLLRTSEMPLSSGDGCGQAKMPGKERGPKRGTWRGV